MSDNLKSEIRNSKLDCQLCEVQSDISDFGFEMQDSSNFKIPPGRISKSPLPSSCLRAIAPCRRSSPPQATSQCRCYVNHPRAAQNWSTVREENESHWQLSQHLIESGHGALSYLHVALGGHC
jgi:hypothetical protein